LIYVFAAAAKKSEADNADWKNIAEGENTHEDNENSNWSIIPRSEYSSLDELTDEGRNDEPGAGETPWEEYNPPEVIQPSVSLPTPVPEVKPTTLSTI
jgi:hypothetical protein